MYWIICDGADTLWGRDVVAESSNGYISSASSVPDAQQTDKEVAGKLLRQHLRDDEYVGLQRRLENDGNVAGVEQLDGVRTVLACTVLYCIGQCNWICNFPRIKSVIQCN